MVLTMPRHRTESALPRIDGPGSTLPHHRSRDALAGPTTAPPAAPGNAGCLSTPGGENHWPTLTRRPVDPVAPPSSPSPPPGSRMRERTSDGPAAKAAKSIHPEKDDVAECALARRRPLRPTRPGGTRERRVPGVQRPRLGHLGTGFRWGRPPPPSPPRKVFSDPSPPATHARTPDPGWPAPRRRRGLTCARGASGSSTCPCRHPTRRRWRQAAASPTAATRD